MRIKVMKFGGTSVATPEARLQSAMRVVEETLSFISTERPTKIPCLVRHHILERCFLFDGPCVGDSLPP